MIDEMCILQSSGTWKWFLFQLTNQLLGVVSMSNTLEIGPNGKIGHYKICMVAKEYTQIYDNIIITFSYCQNDIYPSSLLHCDHHHWTLFQFDIKNVFLH